MNDPEFERDNAKAAYNLAQHGVPFAAIRGFDWESSVTREDTRGDYGERRFLSIGRIGARLHVALWTARGGRPRLARRIQASSNSSASPSGEM